MKKDYESKYHRLEETNWWFLARQDAIIRILKKFPKNSKILDVGCAGGALIKRLIQKGHKNVFGIDISPDAIKVCKKKGLKNVYVCDGARTKFKENSFDAVVASDILEHCRDDESALREWNRILKPEGTLILFVPAFMFLWSDHDVINNHYRRYSLKPLKKLLQKSGFDVLTSSFWNLTTFFPKAIVKTLGRAKKGRDHLHSAPSMINRTLLQCLTLENKAICHGIKIPFGVSIFIFARKLAQSKA